jgi:hypothetical protein
LGVRGVGIDRLDRSQHQAIADLIMRRERLFQPGNSLAGGEFVHIICEGERQRCAGRQCISREAGPCQPLIPIGQRRRQAGRHIACRIAQTRRSQQRVDLTGRVFGDGDVVETEPAE